jgi:phospholipid-binding lipoprotein MlaA
LCYSPWPNLDAIIRRHRRAVPGLGLQQRRGDPTGGNRREGGRRVPGPCSRSFLLAVADGVSRIACSIVVAGMVAIAATGCATPPPESDPEAYAEFRELNDPIEPFNRVVFEINRGLDALFLKPLAEFYLLLLPPPVQTGIHNFVTNLRAPVTFINDLLQGEGSRALNTAGRFAVNTTLGVGGLLDWASDWGMPYHNEDFGQTLAVWGVGEGPYLVLPVIGPSNPRDAAGIGVDSAVLDPFGFLATFIYNETQLITLLSYTRLGLTAVDARARNYEGLNDIERNSLDFYAAMRSLYRQNRQSEINNGRPVPSPDTPTIE